MALKFSDLAAISVLGVALASVGPAHAQCDPSVCANPAAYQCLPTTLAPRTFSTLKAAKAYCRSDPIVWRAKGGAVYGAGAKGFGKMKPGFYMCRFHADLVARVNGELGDPPAQCPATPG